MYGLEPLDGINGITSMLFDNRKALLIGTGVVLVATAAYIFLKKEKKVANTAISKTTQTQATPITQSAPQKDVATLTI